MATRGALGSCGNAEVGAESAPEEGDGYWMYSKAVTVNVWSYGVEADGMD